VCVTRMAEDVVFLSSSLLFFFFSLRRFRGGRGPVRPCLLFFFFPSLFEGSRLGNERGNAEVPSFPPTKIKKRRTPLPLLSSSTSDTRGRRKHGSPCRGHLGLFPPPFFSFFLDSNPDERHRIEQRERREDPDAARPFFFLPCVDSQASDKKTRCPSFPFFFPPLNGRSTPIRQ